MALLSPSTRFRWLCFGTLVDWKLSLKCITGPPSLWGEFGQGFTRQGGGIWQPKFSEGKKRSDIKITHGYSLSTTSWKTTLSSITGCNIFKKKKEPSNNKRRKFIVEHAWTTRSNGMQERTRGKIRTREWLTTDSKRHFFFLHGYIQVSTAVGHGKGYDPQARDVFCNIARLRCEITFVERHAQASRPFFFFSEEEELQQVRRRGKAESLEHWS